MCARRLHREGTDQRIEAAARHELAVAFLDHLDRGPAVFREPLQVGALRERLREERVARGVELPRADLERPQHRVPALLRPPLRRDRIPFRVPEQVRLGRRVERQRHRAQRANERRGLCDVSFPI